MEGDVPVAGHRPRKPGALTTQRFDSSTFRETGTSRAGLHEVPRASAANDLDVPNLEDELDGVQTGLLNRVALKGVWVRDLLPPPSYARRVLLTGRQQPGGLRANRLSSPHEHLPLSFSLVGRLPCKENTRVQILSAAQIKYIRG